MKANRKFLNGDDEAVSPVIAVILMVAITVVLAATVYVWVSGFGSNSSAPAKSMALTSDGAINLDNKTYTVASATPGMKWTDVTFKLDGAPLAYDNLAADAAVADTYCPLDSAAACFDPSTATGSALLIDAGDRVRFHDTAITGQKLLVLDSSSNSIIVTLTIS